jgi:hypothetical protein
MKRVTKYKNTGQQSRDFSATIRLSKKGGGAGSGVDSGGAADVTPRVCLLDITTAEYGAQSSSVYKMAEDIGMTISEYLDANCLGNTATDSTGFTRFLGTKFEGNPLYPAPSVFGVSPFIGYNIFCLAADPKKITYLCSWASVSGIDYNAPPLIKASGEMLFVSFSYISSECDPLDAAGVFTAECYYDGAIVDTITITKTAGGQDYSCPDCSIY